MTNAKGKEKRQEMNSKREKAALAAEEAGNRER